MILDTIKQHIATNNLRDAIKTIFNVLEDTRKLKLLEANELYDELILISGQFESYEQDKKLENIKSEDYNFGINKIRNNILKFLSTVPEEIFKASTPKIHVEHPEASLRELIEIDNKRIDFEYDVFLSFSKLNKDFVLNIANNLRGYGLRVFVYFETIAENVGNSWQSKISNALERSRHFVLVCTPEAMKSENVKDEYENFFNQIHRKNCKRKFIIFEGTNFSENLLDMLYRNKDRATDLNELVKGLLDIKYLNARYLQKIKDEENFSQQTIQDLQNEIKILNDKLKNTENKQTTENSFSIKLIKEAEEAGYNKAIEANKLKIKDLENKIAEQLKIIDNINKTNSETNNINKNVSLSENIQKLNVLNTRIEVFKKTLDIKDKEINSLNEQLKNLKKELDSSLSKNKDVNILNSQIENYKNQIAAKNSDIVSLQKSLKENIEAKQNLEKIKKERNRQNNIPYILLTIAVAIAILFMILYFSNSNKTTNLENKYKQEQNISNQKEIDSLMHKK